MGSGSCDLGYEHSGTPGEFYRSVWTNAGWRHVRAVKTIKYMGPSAAVPFGWMTALPLSTASSASAGLQTSSIPIYSMTI